MSSLRHSGEVKLPNTLSSNLETTFGEKSPPFIQGFGRGIKITPQERQAAFQTDIKGLPLSQGQANTPNPILKSNIDLDMEKNKESEKQEGFDSGESGISSHADSLLLDLRFFGY